VTRLRRSACVSNSVYVVRDGFCFKSNCRERVARNEESPRAALGGVVGQLVERRRAAYGTVGDATDDGWLGRRRGTGEHGGLSHVVGYGSRWALEDAVAPFRIGAQPLGPGPWSAARLRCDMNAQPCVIAVSQLRAARSARVEKYSRRRDGATTARIPDGACVITGSGVWPHRSRLRAAPKREL
jgi:hypothetical protein